MGKHFSYWRRLGRGVIVLVAVVAALVAAVGARAAGAPSGSANTSDKTTLHPFTITSPDFKDGHRLPSIAEFGGGFGCTGQNLAPAVRWTNVPTGTASFAFTINDVDAPVAGGFHHWVVYNIPAGTTGLAGHGQNPFSEGTTSFGTTGYGGPCPPPDGHEHHYIFTVYALSVPQIPGQAITFEGLIQEMGPSVLDISSIVGTFTRPTNLP